MKIYFECTECKEVEPINIVALSANGFGLECSVCKTYFTFGVVAVEHPLAPDGAKPGHSEVVKIKNGVWQETTLEPRAAGKANRWADSLNKENCKMMYEVLQKENSVYLIITYPKQMTVIMDNSDAEKVAKAILASLPKSRPTKRAVDVAEVCDCGEPFPKSGYCEFCGAHERQRH